ncbi:MAG: hypothetical protein Q9160_003502 [Pyrenula sp. 1 TL-2023]
MVAILKDNTISLNNMGSSRAHTGKVPNTVNLNMVNQSQALAPQPDKIALVHLNKAAFNTVNKATNTVHTTPATPKASQLTSNGGDQRGYDPNQQYHQQQQQQQPYGQGYDQSNPQHQGQPGQNAPYDPNAPEGERGLGGALAGGAAGLFLGKKTGHSFLGSVGGAIMGSLAQDKYKDHGKHSGHHGKHSNSSWGGSGKW